MRLVNVPEWDEPEETLDPWEDCPNCESKDAEIEELQDRITVLEGNLQYIIEKLQRIIKGFTNET